MFVVLDHFRNDESEQFLGELRIEIGIFGEALKPRDLVGFTRRIRRRERMLGLQSPYGLRMFKPLRQRVDND